MRNGQEERYLWNGDLLHIPQQFLRCHLHFVEGKPTLAKVFQRGTDMVDGIIDAKVAVVDAVVLLHVDGLILCVPHCI